MDKKDKTTFVLQRLMAFMVDVVELTQKTVHVSVTIEPETVNNDPREVTDEKRVFISITVDPGATDDVEVKVGESDG
ncbi:MAG: hypothetical protein E6Q97_07195 [Desulfurellales bacterium]|nr:MAG: hypothetical protein E6Q97_07195 [Desulfurellales bacterium]